MPLSSFADRRPTRAMVLAAGLGTRLRPLTDALPKPLVPVGNRPLLRHHLALLKAFGVEEVMVNLHHLPEAIPAALGDGSSLGLRLHYSREAEILGTGGGVKAVEGFLREPDRPFFLLNGDLMIEVSLEEVYAVHCRHQAVATMVLREDPAAAQFGVLGVDEGDRILDFVGRARWPGEVRRGGLFTGIHVLEPEILALLPKEPNGINLTVYPQLVREGRRVQACFQKGFWSDVGTPERYLEANLAVVNGSLFQPGRLPQEEAAWATDGVQQWGRPEAVEGLMEARVRGSAMVGHGVRLGRGAALEGEVVLGEGARVGAGARLSRAVVWPGAEVPAGIRLRGAVVWRAGQESRILQVEAPDQG